MSGTFQPIHAGHADIEQHHVDRLLLDQRQRIESVVGFSDDINRELIRAIGQHVMQSMASRCLVIDDEDAQRRAGWCVHGCRE